MATFLGVAAAQVTPGLTGQVVRARILGAAAALITQASLTSIKQTTTDLSLEALQAGSGAVATRTLTISQVLFNSLIQNDPVWQQDSVNQPGVDGRYGYNFMFTIPAADFTNSGDSFQADFAFTPVSGEPFRIRVKIPTAKVYG